MKVTVENILLIKCRKMALLFETDLIEIGTRLISGASCLKTLSKDKQDPLTVSDE